MRWIVGSDRSSRFSELTLVYPEKRARGSQLTGGDHEFTIKSDVNVRCFLV